MRNPTYVTYDMRKMITSAYHTLHLYIVSTCGSNHGSLAWKYANSFQGPICIH